MHRTYWLVRVVFLSTLYFSCSGPDLKEIPDLTPPSIELLNPIPGQVISDDIVISTLVNDEFGVERVEFFIDDSLLSTDSLAPWEYQWEIMDYMDGKQHDIFAKAYDYAGNMSQSITVTISTYGIMTDIDGHTYKTIRIGNQIWMAENLKVTHYKNGDIIPSNMNDSLWYSLSMGASANYPTHENYVNTFGLLYNWYTINNSRDLAPEGWHIPTYNEWLELIDLSGGLDSAGNTLKDSRSQYWTTSSSDTPSESLFMALPGSRRNEDGGYNGSPIGQYGFFWTSTEDSEYLAWFFQLSAHHSRVSRGHYDKRNGFSIRCVKN